MLCPRKSTLTEHKFQQVRMDVLAPVGSLVA